jgi:hypothetical protein
VNSHLVMLFSNDYMERTHLHVKHPALTLGPAFRDRFFDTDPEEDKPGMVSSAP